MAYFRAKLQSEKIVPETTLKTHQRSMQEMAACKIQLIFNTCFLNDQHNGHFAKDI